MAGTIGFSRFSTTTAINIPARSSDTGQQETLDDQTISSDFLLSLTGAAGIAFHLLQSEPTDVRRLADVLIEVKARVKFCTICFNVSEDDQCRICRDPRRDQTVLCVVEEYKDVVAIERTREFKGRYHVMGGAISPIDGIGPDQLRIRELMVRLADGAITEVILATDPNLEGEATATYLTRMLREFGLRITRLASGLPVGGDLEYADEVTLGRAFVGRRSADE